MWASANCWAHTRRPARTSAPSPPVRPCHAIDRAAEHREPIGKARRHLRVEEGRPLLLADRRALPARAAKQQFQPCHCLCRLAAGNAGFVLHCRKLGLSGAEREARSRTARARYDQRISCVMRIRTEAAERDTLLPITHGAVNLRPRDAYVLERPVVQGIQLALGTAYRPPVSEGARHVPQGWQVKVPPCTRARIRPNRRRVAHDASSNFVAGKEMSCGAAPPGVPSEARPGRHQRISRCSRSTCSSSSGCRCTATCCRSSRSCDSRRSRTPAHASGGSGEWP